MDFRRSKTNKKLDVWLTLTLLTVLFLGSNFIVSKINYNLDLTPESIHSLSFESTAQLSQITSPVNIFVTIPQDTNQPKIIQKLLHDFKIIAESIENLNLRHEIKFHYINIDTIHDNSDIVIKNKITERNSIIVSTPTGSKKVLFQYELQEDLDSIQTDEIYRSENSLAREAVWESGLYDNWKESTNAVLVPTQFKGEELLVKSIVEIATAKPQRHVVYFTRGHGEASPSDVNLFNGYSEFRTMIEDKNLIVSTIDLSTVDQVPDDGKLLVIANPKGIFQDQEVSIIREFINGEQGSLLVTIDPTEEIALMDKPAFGLRETLRAWGIRCHDILVYDADERNFDIFSGDYSLRTYSKNSKHSIVNSLREGGYSVQSNRLRPIESIPTTDSEFISMELIYSSRTSWGVTSWSNRKFPPEKNSLLDIDGPLPVITISERSNETKKTEFSSRIIVIGTSTILSNKKLKNSSGNRILSSKIIYWLTQKQNMMDIEPKKIPLYNLTLNKPELENLMYALSVVPITIALIGLFVGWLRKEL